MAEYANLEEGIRSFKRARIVNPFFISLYALATPFLAIGSINNLYSEGGNSTKGIICALVALYTSYKAFKGIKTQSDINMALARLQEEQRASLEEKVE